MVLGSAQTAPAPRNDVSSIRILFGLTDNEPTVWDGTVSLDSGSVKAIQGWRFGPEDSTDYARSWKAATRSNGDGPDSVLENGILVTAEASQDARWSLHTPKGDFSFTLHDVPWGDQKTFLDGAVAIDRVPPTTQLTTSDDDEDYPAIAHHGGETWMTFTRFSHTDRTLETYAQIGKPPESFDYLARPAGGDQVFAARYDPASGKWLEPAAVSPKGEDATRATVAIDGRNRVWVVWSAQRDGHFNLFARVKENSGGSSAWGPEFRVTSGDGPDLNPVAATDAAGRVWIAWQGFRNRNLEVLAAAQSSVENGNAFSPEAVVSFSPASDWDPSIATAPNGEVAIAWDTYDKGDYDVWFRRLQSAAGSGRIELQAPVAVAATENFEARPSAVYDLHNRLWVAYEVASPRWGKGFGTFDSTGSPLYEDRNIRIRCFEGDNIFTTSGDLINVLPGPPNALRRGRARSNRIPIVPNPNVAKNRRQGQAVGPRNASLNGMPRLAADPAGGIYLAFRSLDGPYGARSPVGSIWFEHVVYFDGHNWVGPVFLPRTDGAIDSAPALLTLEPGRLLAVSAMDHRQSIPQSLGVIAADRINSDLYSADLRLEGSHPPAAKPELMSMKPEKPAAPDPDVRAERDQVALVRNYRVDVGGEPLRILRGDMNRHTSYSVDGTREGSLTDAYRYMIDAAALDWGGCCDNENGSGHEYFWWTQQKMTDEYHLSGGGDAVFVPLFSWQRGVRYPEGWRNVLMSRRGVRPVPHMPALAPDAPFAPSPDIRMLYKYLQTFGGVSVPQSTATDVGTDWRDRDPLVEPVVEIFEGGRQSYERQGAPRAAATPDDSIRPFRPAGTVTAALEKGLRLGFVASSGQFSTHSAYANVLVPAATRDAIVDAFRKRHVYASTANIVADVRSGDHVMGDEFFISGKPSIAVKLVGSAPFTKVTIVKDGRDVYVAEPKSREVNFAWSDGEAQTGKTSWYYVRGEQEDGNLVWASPMWITVKP